MCVPITLQDSSFRTSYIAGLNQLVLIFPITLGVGGLVVTFGAFLVWASVERLGGSSSEAIASAIVAAALLTGTSVLIAKRIFETHGFKTVKARGALDFVRSLLARIRRRKGLASGVLILKTSDDSWKDVVSLALRGADAVVIDISELTNNLIWELVKASELLPARSIILASATEAGKPAQLVAEVERRLNEVFADGTRSQIQILFYPAFNPPLGPERGRTYSELSDRLRVTVAKALSSSARSRPDKPSNTPWGLAILRTYLFVSSTTASALFIFFSFVFGPYDLRNATEAAFGSYIIATLVSLPLLGWLIWHKRKRT
jgi:hypothetical protein